MKHRLEQNYRKSETCWTCQWYEPGLGCSIDDEANPVWVETDHVCDEWSLDQIL